MISTLLLQETEITGRIHLLQFYFRRTLRIFPPYYTLIFGLILLRLSGFITLSNHDLFHALTYTSNYFAPQGWYLGHTWSLAVEAQFYLLWPATLLLFGKRRAVFAAALLLIICPLMRMLSMFHIGHNPESAAFEIVADSLACGCLLVLLRKKQQANFYYQKLLTTLINFSVL